MHILLAGGTGFFGRALLNHWQNCFAEGIKTSKVSIFTRNPELFLKKYPRYIGLHWLGLYKADIMKPHTMQIDEPVTHLLHAASDSTHISELSPLQIYTQIVDGTRNLLDFAVANGINRFLLTSSGAVYGPCPDNLEGIPEDWLGSPALGSPQNAYGLGKRMAEYLCTLYADSYPLETVIARCFAFAGPDLPLDAHFAIGNFIQDALAADGLKVNGDGTAIRSYLDQTDLAKWLLTLLERGKPGQAYNVGSDEAVSISELAYIVRDELAPSKPVRIQSKSSEILNRSRYVPLIRKASEELGLSQTVSLRESIRRIGEKYSKRNIKSLEP